MTHTTPKNRMPMTVRIVLAGLALMTALPAVSALPIGVEQQVTTAAGSIDLAASDNGIDAGADAAIPALPLPVALPIATDGRLSTDLHAGMDGASADLEGQAAGVKADTEVKADASYFGQFVSWVKDLF